MRRQNSTGKKTRKIGNAGCFFAIAIPLSFVIISFVAFLIISLILRSEYRNWEDRFENSHLSEDFTYVQDSEEILEGVSQKVEEFSESSEETTSLELTPVEVFWVFARQFENSVTENISVERGYVDSDYGTWSIYLQTKYKERTLPWIVIHLEKEEGEGVEIFVSAISLGSYNITDFGLRKTVEEVNAGLSDAFTLVNQSDFTGRRFENIELEPSMMTIKGRR